MGIPQLQSAAWQRAAGETQSFQLKSASAEAADHPADLLLRCYTREELLNQLEI